MLTLALPQIATADPIPQPPLRSGEAMVVLADNCSLVVEVRRRTDEEIRRIRDGHRQATWRGECHNGLVHGTGAIVVPEDGGAYEMPGNYYFGRREPVFQTSSGVSWYETRAGARAVASPDAELENPVWRPSPMRPDDPRATMIAVNDQRIEAYVSACADCQPDYGVRLSSVGPNAPPPVTAPCPDPHSPAGCEALWRRLAASLLSNYREVRVQAIAGLPLWRAELARLNAARDARLESQDAASRSALEWTLLAARNEAASGDSGLKARLDAANAGELFAMADEFRRAGDNGRARRALTTLLSRFPDHSLAVTAAQQLSSLGEAAPVACAAPEEEARLARGLTEAMRRLRSDDAVGRLESVLYTLDRSAAAYARCADDPDSTDRIGHITEAYVRTARLCAEVSPSGECAARLH